MRPLGYRQQRSIPACAGEPRRRRPRAGGCRVYPRVCGGTKTLPGGELTAIGLSPRVRGNLRRQSDDLLVIRSIPACAGEPMRQDPKLPQHKVYPRVCGGTAVRVRAKSGKEGLSPRVRGNPCDAAQGYGAAGSIPACAGEPRAAKFPRAPATVYPRVCGGTGGGGILWYKAPGLSPRVRGNP